MGMFRLNSHSHSRLFSAAVLASSLSLAVGCGPTSFKITPVPADRTLRERVLLRGEGFFAPKIALIDVDGILLNTQTGNLFTEGEQPVATLTEKLARARKDKRVKAVVLRINSPGGSVTASELMHSEIVKFKQRTGKPVIAVFMDVAASGGYYIACACDEIIAHPSTVTGSIGVIMQMFNVAGTMQKLGITADAIKSGPNKDAGSPFRNMTPAERGLFQTMVNQFYEDFLKVVEAGRPDMEPDKIRELADGRVYTAAQALEHGLIDRIGTLDDAIRTCMKRTGLETAHLVTYHRPLAYKPNVYARAPAGTNDRTLTLALPGWLTSPTPRFMYLWAPGW